uniref:Uncharacterized protein n=1 Tax=Myripristis murdjan TaxID=586833 RepID=A0A667Z563_9TELE
TERSRLRTLPCERETRMTTPVGILCIEENSQLNPSRVGIVLEGSVVMEKLATLPQAFLDRFMPCTWITYMKNTSLFIQQVMLNLGRGELAPKIQSLKNQLSVKQGSEKLFNCF